MNIENKQSNGEASDLSASSGSRCRDCQHFKRSETYSAAITEKELRQCYRRGVKVMREENFFRKLINVSKDGSCMKMTSDYKTPSDGVKYTTTSGNQWNEGIGAPRVGENFGCIHFENVKETQH